MKKQQKQRADTLLVLQGIAPSIHIAQRYIMAGIIYYTDKHAQNIRVEKSGTIYSEDTLFRCKESSKYVSRGGYKLETALEHFSIDVSNAICLDIGSSTGGFTDCLLQYGASKVYALDVSEHLLHEKLQKDSRVIEKSPYNIKNLQKNDIPDTIDIVVGDISFISLSHLFLPVFPLLSPRAKLILLLKPQFEVEKNQLVKGIVHDISAQEKVIETMISYTKTLPLEYHGSIASAIKGRKGNQEYLLYYSYTNT